MISRSRKSIGWSFLISAITPFITPVLAQAAQISSSLDIPGIRGKIAPNEGYLSYHFLFSPFGEERTGWTDVRHPAFFNGTGGPQTAITKDNRGFGYDRSDFHVDVRNIIVTDSNGVVAMPNIERDYDFANQIYAQLGISVLNAGNVSGTYNNVTFPINENDLPAAIDPILSQNRANPPIVNNYYIRDFSDNPNPQDNPPKGTFGFTVSPEDTLATANPKYANSGVLVIDPNRGARTDTFAHELGHFLIDNYRFAENNGCDTVHSGVATDLMACGRRRTIPGTQQKGSGNTAPSQPGQKVGNIGGTSLFDGEKVRPTGNTGAFDTSQIEAIYAKESDGNTYVQTQDNGLTYGDCADFDWVEDNIPLELAASKPSGDNRADNHDSVDFMVWEIGPVACSSHKSQEQNDWLKHDHADWGQLTLPAFTGDSFNIVDIVSQIARYADMDIDSAGKWSPRESALDYLLEFSANGTNWVTGKPITVFKDGWTFNSKADDFVARWLSPINAKYIRIAADPLVNQHDRNTQIDAIIAARITIPESSCVIGLLTFGALGIGSIFKPQSRLTVFFKKNCGLGNIR